MSTPFSTKVDALAGKYATAKTLRAYANSQSSQAREDWDVGEYWKAIDHNINATDQLAGAVKEMVYEGTHPDFVYPLIDILKLCWEYETESPSVSMDSIINAMLTADPEQVLYFIGLVDAFRNSVWTRPFNQEFYAALSQGFQEWP